MGIMGDLFCEGFEASGTVRRNELYDDLVCGVRVTFGEADPRHERGGRYATLMCGKLWDIQVNTSLSEATAEVFVRFASDMLVKPLRRILVCALGNEKVTADSLGSRTADRTLAGEVGGCQVFVIKTGTPAATGISSGEVATTFAVNKKVDLVICIDALAAITPERLGSVIQITNCGIAPGSGVSEHSTVINGKTLGVPVLSIGIPTVIRGDGGILYTCAMTDELIRRGSAVIAGGINGFAARDVCVKSVDLRRTQVL